ncbi:MAG: right-handed parallel beta-helix repeat-containing protein, partial [candidate division Zixibacteria bacterium]|nr:right-handed parallel beta-helix repeat-containing protein [candidate division Zixibacteria bacterium]
MAKFISVFGLVVFLIVATVSSATLTVQSGSGLQSIINHAQSGDTLVLATGNFLSNPMLFNDSLCGNCDDPQTLIKATVGFVIHGKSLVIRGADRNSTMLVTNAGYGLYIEDCQSVEISNLTVTGGRRDSIEMATDAGIVVRRSQVKVTDVNVRNNDHRIDSVIVGISGIIGREGAELEIRNCTIENNGWDGVALYRGAVALISDCLIKNGRGAGIGVTWDATCFAYRNEVTDYWKGIGAFGTSWVIARNNLIHDNLGWGMIATGQSHMDMVNNVVYHNGNCGIAPWSTESHGRIVNNIVVENGWREEWVCPCVGVWNNGDWAKWEFQNNIVFNNAEGEYEAIWDQADLNGNMNIDPLFVGDGDFHLKAGSPALNSGDSLIYNLDGSVSHIGLYGGPHA